MAFGEIGKQLGKTTSFLGGFYSVLFDQSSISGVVGIKKKKIFKSSI